MREAFREMLSPASPVYHMLGSQVAPYGYKTRVILHALTRGLSTPGQIAKEIPNLSTAAANVYLKRLVSYGVVETKEGEYSVLDPVLKAFIVEAPP